MKSQLAPHRSDKANETTEIVWREPASLPQLAKKDDSKKAKDVYQSILWRIEAKCVANESMAVGLIGCLKKSGSSTIAANLATQASRQHGGRVLLIDANWQTPGLLKQFQVARKPGLYDILSGELSPKECETQAIGDNVDLLCRGKWDEDQPTLVRQELVQETLSALKEDYSLILVDLPVAEEQRSALPLARHLDGTLLIARFEGVKQPQAQRALRRLEEDGVNVWGAILNRHREYVPKWLRSWL